LTCKVVDTDVSEKYAVSILRSGDAGSMFLGNVGIYLRAYAASQPGRKVEWTCRQITKLLHEDNIVCFCETLVCTYHKLIPARKASLAAMQGSASGSNVRFD
jgi:hypothetical protein